jgi:hypothetical protein
VVGLGVGIKLAVDARNEFEVPRAWASVECTIVSKDIERHHSTDSDGHSSTTFSPEITFRYEFEGRAFSIPIRMRRILPPGLPLTRQGSMTG